MMVDAPFQTSTASLTTTLHQIPLRAIAIRSQMRFQNVVNPPITTSFLWSLNSQPEVKFQSHHGVDGASSRSGKYFDRTNNSHFKSVIMTGFIVMAALRPRIVVKVARETFRVYS
jgi:hypothetical protein